VFYFRPLKVKFNSRLSPTSPETRLKSAESRTSNINISPSGTPSSHVIAAASLTIMHPLPLPTPHTHSTHAAMPPPSPPVPSGRHVLLVLLPLLLPLLASSATTAAAAEPPTVAWSFFTIGDWVRASFPLPSCPFTHVDEQAQPQRSWVSASSFPSLPSLLQPPHPFLPGSLMPLTSPFCRARASRTKAKWRPRWAPGASATNPTSSWR
jgi:hypothetical protein